ncbi:pao retrotransposon peptidase domain-containing protein [Phthorimaea operculella]|nr:pao retrotransposon peptidase domain-containing protein [Phthorimaea operculella]
MKALGLQINIKDDQFIISSPEPFNSQKVTKRSILSYIGRIYDPMGFVGPIVVTAKAIMQKLWVSNCDWNGPPPIDVQKEWLHFTEQLANMKPITIPRNVGISDSHTAQLIGFCDAASSKAYGACLYLRLIDRSGMHVITHLLCSKSRINPLQKNKMTVPRLELNAALLLSKLVVKAHDTLQLKINISDVFLFSDSQIVLAWLKTEKTKLQAYVANRVNVIQQDTARWRWLYVNTHDNPADLISRGVQPGELNNNELWWRGPPFIQNRVSMRGYCMQDPDFYLRI